MRSRKLQPLGMSRPSGDGTPSAEQFGFLGCARNDRVGTWNDRVGTWNGVAAAHFGDGDRPHSATMGTDPTNKKLSQIKKNLQVTAGGFLRSSRAQHSGVEGSPRRRSFDCAAFRPRLHSASLRTNG